MGAWFQRLLSRDAILGLDPAPEGVRRLIVGNTERPDDARSNKEANMHMHLQRFYDDFSVIRYVAIRNEQSANPISPRDVYPIRL